MEYVDAFSRAPYEEARELDTASLQIAKTVVSEGDWIFSMQFQDNKICEIVEKMNSGHKQSCDG